MGLHFSWSVCRVTGQHGWRLHRPRRTNSPGTADELAVIQARQIRKEGLLRTMVMRKVQPTDEKLKLFHLTTHLKTGPITREETPHVAMNWHTHCRHSAGFNAVLPGPETTERVHAQQIRKKNMAEKSESNCHL